MRSNETYELTPKFTAGNYVRAVFSVIGLIIALIGLIMTLSIVMIIPGLFGVIIGIVVAYFAVPTVKTECRECGTTNTIKLGSKGVDCEGCKRRMVVKWNKSDSPLLSWSALFSRIKSKKDG